MNVTLLFPRNREEGEYFERLIQFAARRARTYKDHKGLWEEINNSTPEKRANFVRQVAVTEWSLDVLEMSFFMYDIEGIPSWLPVELYRHRFLFHDWSPEQRSKRALQADKLPVVNPYKDLLDNSLAATRLAPENARILRRYNKFEELAKASQEFMREGREAGEAPQLTRYAALEGAETALCLAANARALHHLFTMRGSKTMVGETGGKAAPEFQEMVEIMYTQAKEVCPLIFEKVLIS